MPSPSIGEGQRTQAMYRIHSAIARVCLMYTFGVYLGTEIKTNYLSGRSNRKRIRAKEHPP